MSEEALGDIALIGLAVMGQNFILNMNDHGFKVVAFNRTVDKVTEFLNNEAKGTNVIGATSLQVQAIFYYHFFHQELCINRLFERIWLIS